MLGAVIDELVIRADPQAVLQTCGRGSNATQAEQLQLAEAFHIVGPNFKSFPLLSIPFSGCCAAHFVSCYNLCQLRNLSQRLKYPARFQYL